MKTAKTTTPTADVRPPIAVSYIRFSTPEQRKGDSLRRQTEATEEWCERKKLTLDRTLRDCGKSAYRGKHRSDTAALGRFLELAKNGDVPRGSFLIIENLDRLSREDERTALRLWLDLLDAGVNIVQLNPETVFRCERSDMTDIIRAIIELSRGHSESRMRSVRTTADRDEKVRLAREKADMPPRRKDRKVTKLITGRLPAWVEEKDGLPALVPERAAVVRRIFEMATADLGITSIVKRLTAEGVPAFGDREPDPEGGGYRGKKGMPLGCGVWRRSYIRSILKDRRVLGEYQPRDRDGKPKDEPIVDYYPPVVSADEFRAARTEVENRENRKREGEKLTLNPQGRLGNGVPNLFGGLLRNARDGETYYVGMRKTNGEMFRYLLNRAAREGTSKCYMFPLAVFERAILSELRELKPADVLGPKKGRAVVAVLERELDEIRKRKAAFSAELMRGDVAAVPAIADKLRELEAREAELEAKVETAAVEKARPLAETWRDAKTLTDLLATAPEDELADVRERLRAKLRRIVDSIWLLVVPRGKDRLCAVRVYFPSGAYRSYLIVFRSGAGNQNAKRPGRYAVLSVRHEDDGVWRYWRTGERPTWNPKRARVVAGVEDLRDEVGAEMVRKGLEDYPAWAIESDLKDGEEAPRS